MMSPKLGGFGFSVVHHQLYQYWVLREPDGMCWRYNLDLSCKDLGSSILYSLCYFLTPGLSVYKALPPKSQEGYLNLEAVDKPLIILQEKLSKFSHNLKNKLLIYLIFLC